MLKQQGADMVLIEQDIVNDLYVEELSTEDELGSTIQVLSAGHDEPRGASGM
jgi:hypothetical protein